MLKAALLLLSGNMAGSLLSLARNILVARLIPLEDYAIAATFIIVLSLIEMTSQFGLQQQIVQSDQGDDPRFQAALQGFQLLRGSIAGLALVLLGGPLANFMNMPEAAWAYRLLGVVPVLIALQHFDVFRLNREMRFGPQVLSQTAPVAVTLVLLWPLSAWLPDYRMMLVLLLVQFVLWTLLSHLVAQRPWRARLDLQAMRGAVRFGWPLLVNNALLFAVFNGDRVVVGRELGAEALAIFSMGMTLTLTPTLVFARSAQSFFLPQLSRLHHAGAADPAPFRRLATAVIEAALVSSLCFAAAVVLFGPLAVDLLLGSKYGALVPAMALFGVAQAFRLFKLGPEVVGLAAGRTANPMIANSLRLAALPVAWWLAVRGGDMRLIILTMIAGELAGGLLAIAVLWRQVPLAMGEIARAYGLAIVVLAGLAAAAWAAPGALPPLEAGLAMLGLSIGAAALMPALRGYLAGMLRRLRRGRGA